MIEETHITDPCSAKKQHNTQPHPQVQKIRLEGQVRNLQLTMQQKDNMIDDLNGKIEEMKGEKEHLSKVISQTEHSAMQVS